jgi:hypothetical protein
VTLKYIDPTYMIRTVPAIASDKRMCCDLAWSAVNGAMAGFTGFTVGHINNSVAMIPLSAINDAGGKNKVTKNYRGWQRLLAGTGQPFFLNDKPIGAPPAPSTGPLLAPPPLPPMVPPPTTDPLPTVSPAASVTASVHLSS